MLLDVGFHHIHAHAAAGDVRHLLGGREAGQQYQLGRFALRHSGSALGADQALFHGFLANALEVQPGAIVGDFDIHLAALVIGP